MSITKRSSPTGYVPYINPQNIVATSNQVGNADFVYDMDCTDVLSGGTVSYRIPKLPVTAELLFNAQIFVKKYIKHFVPNNQYGWRVCTDALRKINIEYKEFYGGVLYAASPPVTTEYFVWNSVLRTLAWTDYNQYNYVYTNADPFKYLITGTPETNYKMPRGFTYSDKSLFLYFLANVSNTFEILRVKTYDASGNLLGTSDINNTYYNSANYQEKYLCIDIGHKGLSNISAGDVTGTYPIITSSVAYYELFDVNTSAGSPPVGSEEPIRRVDILCEPAHDVHTLHYLAPLGNFETIHFPKVSLLTEEMEKRFYGINPNKMVDYVWSYDKFTPHQKAFSVTGQEKLLMNSDWMTPEQAAIHRELISSPLVYLDLGSTSGLVPYKVIDNLATVNKNYNKKLFGLTITTEPTYKNNYQNG